MLEINKIRLEVSKFPRNATCAVTSSWDDNNRDNMEILSILDSRNLKGTFYIDPGREHGNALADSDIQTLASKQDLGSHTWSHPNLILCDEKKIYHEFRISKDYIENVTGRPIFGLAYPYGKRSPMAEKAAQECGYLFARTVDAGQVAYPPSNPYRWGISVYALGSNLTPRRLLSKRTLRRLVSIKIAKVYYRNLSAGWRTLALKLFEKARRENGVFHLFGHATEILQPGLKDQFLEICSQVCGMDDVWYTTNSTLFLNEIVKNHTSVTRIQHPLHLTFKIEATFPLNNITRDVPMPLVLVVPISWKDKFRVDVTTTSSGTFKIGERAGQIWIDVYDNAAQVDVIPR